MNKYSDRITKVYGSVYTVEYDAVDGKVDGKFTQKPYVKENCKFDRYKELCSFKGEPYYGDKLYKSIYIGDEKLRVTEEKFVADLNEIHLYTIDNCEKETLNSKEEVKSYVDDLIKEFNKIMIESDERMLRYTKLHKLDLEETDCEELFKLVYDGLGFKIRDGKMIVDDSLYTRTIRYNDCLSNSSVISSSEIAEIAKYAATTATAVTSAISGV